jgi:hypothetical protein
MYKSLGVLLALAVQFDMQMDVATAFLHGELEEEIIMTPPDGVPVPTQHRNKVWRLKKSLYGLKQSPRMWNLKIHNFLVEELGYDQLKSDPALYVKFVDGVAIILSLYVDDMLLLSSNQHLITELKAALCAKFEMKDCGQAKHILGMRVDRDWKAGTLTLTQGRYAKEVVSRFNQEDSRSVVTPFEAGTRLSQAGCPVTDMAKAEMQKRPYRELVGCLQFLQTSTRPDLAYPISVLSKYGCNPGAEHW